MYQLQDVSIFKNDSTTRISVHADLDLEDIFSEYHGTIILGDRDAVDKNGAPYAQNIGVQFEFLLLKAIQEFKTVVDLL